MAASSSRSRIENQVLRIRTLAGQGLFAEGLAAAEALLLEVPENRDLLLITAVCQRQLHRVPAALATLAVLEVAHPGYSHMLQERGHCYAAAGNAAAAIDAYLRAVNVNVTLAASWNALQSLFRAGGRLEDADKAAAHVAKLAQLPAAVVVASGLLADGEIDAAEQVLRQFLLEHGDHIEAMRLLAQTGMKREVFHEAELLLAKILALSPDYAPARYDYALVLLRRHRNLEAVREADKLVRADPANRSYRLLYASASVALGNHAEALKTYRELLAQTPRAAAIHVAMGNVLKALGREAEAIGCYRSAGAAAPSYGAAYWSLAELKTYRFSDEEIARMRQYEELKATAPADRCHLRFALARALQDRAEYAESFSYYQRGNALKYAQVRYSPQPMERTARRQMATCTEAFFAQREYVGCPSDAPIFVVGMPESGSALLQWILASHSMVEGTMELAEIPRLVHSFKEHGRGDSTPRYPQVLADLSPAQCKELGERYIAETQVHRTDRPFFVDGNPNNFRHIGFIHLILPNAKIIDARREPMACCFSSFKQLFALGGEFTYRLEDLARYYRAYVALMAHWDRVLPGKILRIQYEELLQDPAGNVRRLLDFCGLKVEPGCLRPLPFEAGLDDWRKFEPWLDPLKSALGNSS
jgi:tetratricopeptide (TPR) repeat protein